MPRVTEREAQRRERQRKSPVPSRRPAFLTTTTTPAAVDAVGPQSAGAQNILLDPRPPPNKRYITAAQLRERYGGVSHMWLVRRLRNDPTFPRPVKLGGSLIRMWCLDEIEAWERAAVTKQGRETGRAR